MDEVIKGKEKEIEEMVGFYPRGKPGGRGGSRGRRGVKESLLATFCFGILIHSYMCFLLFYFFVSRERINLDLQLLRNCNGQQQCQTVARDAPKSDTHPCLPPKLFTCFTFLFTLSVGFPVWPAQTAWQMRVFLSLLSLICMRRDSASKNWPHAILHT